MRDKMTTWRTAILVEMGARQESWDDVEHFVLRNKKRYYDDEPDERPMPSLDAPFKCGYSGTNGCWFTLWTKARVYFPVQYDGAEWVGSVPRNPCEEATKHVGGGS